MARPKKIRRVGLDPKSVYFKPRGIPLTELDEVILTIDELEAIKLKGCFCMDQTQSAKTMKVSQSTFQRILSSANEKIADALVHHKAIKVEGGNVQKSEYKMKDFSCKDCKFRSQCPKFVKRMRCRCPRKTT